MKTMHLKIAARQSPLSQAQVEEVIQELEEYHAFSFELLTLPTTGDLDLETSLRSLDKTDFFTRELDQLLLDKKCRVAIHSAKDLPDPLPEGLQIAAITVGVDPRDSLVLREGAELNSLPKGAVIAASSQRREDAIQSLRPDLTFTDIRGTVPMRLAKLQSGEVDGLVVAEAALIRLGLTGINRMILSGETTPYQGKLAVLIREEDEEMLQFFECIDSRSRVLYTGLDLPRGLEYKRIIHCPLIEIHPRQKGQVQNALNELGSYTHLLFTSKSTARIFTKYADHREIAAQCVIAIGRSTANCLRENGIEVDIIAKNETSEGIVDLLRGMNLQKAYLFWPHSALSRSIITDYFRDNHIHYRDCVFYDTHLRIPSDLPDLSELDEVIFTSPSTVDAFLQCYGSLPSDLALTPIGSVTAAKLLECQN